MPAPLKFVKLVCLSGFLSVYDALARSFAPTTDCFALIADSIVVTHIHTHTYTQSHTRKHTHTHTHTHIHTHKFVRVSKTSGATVKNTSTFT